MQFSSARSDVSVQAKPVLYIVEGLSAANAVCKVRDTHQAVFAMQGKPKNTLHITCDELLANEWFAGLVGVLGAGVGDEFSLAKVKYAKVVLLMDANSDGMHCVMLMLLFFYRWMRPLLELELVCLARAPLGALVDAKTQAVQLAWDVATFERFVAACQEEGATLELSRYAGLASMPSAVLYEACLGEKAQKSVKLTVADASRAIALIG